jgi:hypothetical protein
MHKIRLAVQENLRNRAASRTARGSNLQQRNPVAVQAAQAVVQVRRQAPESIGPTCANMAESKTHNRSNSPRVFALNRGPASEKQQPSISFRWQGKADKRKFKMN